MRSLLKERRILIKLIWFVTILFVLIPTGNSQAHSEIKRSIPSEGEIVDEPPGLVQIWFGLVLDTFESFIIVVDSSGQRVDLDDSVVSTTDRTEMSVHLSPNLPAGDYTVRWTAVDDTDAHQVGGEYIFTVAGTRTPTGDPGISSKSIGLLILVGVGVIALVMWGVRKRTT